jgi:hypothetical protein
LSASSPLHVRMSLNRNLAAAAEPGVKDHQPSSFTTRTYRRESHNCCTPPTRRVEARCCGEQPVLSHRQPAASRRVMLPPFRKRDRRHHGGSRLQWQIEAHCFELRRRYSCSHRPPRRMTRDIGGLKIVEGEGVRRGASACGSTKGLFLNK